MRFWVVFRSERAVSTIFPPYIMPNGTYERIKKFYDTLPLKFQSVALVTILLINAFTKLRKIDSNVHITFFTRISENRLTMTNPKKEGMMNGTLGREENWHRHGKEENGKNQANHHSCVFKVSVRETLL